MESFLETFMELRRVQGVSCYSVFIFEPLRNLHLRISKLVKKCTENCLSFDRLRTGGVERGRK